MKKDELKEKTEARAAEISQMEEVTEDFKTLISALPPGQRKNLLKDDTCGAILNKYGVS